MHPAQPSAVESPVVGTDAAWSDVDLLARCRAGDAEAWDILVSRYDRLVFSVALRCGASREDAADVTQTTFVALLDSIDRLEDESRLVSWLMTVSRRHAWRAGRRARREPLVGGGEITSLNPIEDWERQTWIHEGLQELEEPCRSLLHALFFDPTAPSYATLAQRMGRTVGGIGPLRGRCLERLRLILGEEPEGGS